MKIRKARTIHLLRQQENLGNTSNANNHLLDSQSLENLDPETVISESIMESLISLDYTLASFLAAESPSLLSQPAPTGFLTFSSDFGTL